MEKKDIFPSNKKTYCTTKNIIVGIHVQTWYPCILFPSHPMYMSKQYQKTIDTNIVDKEDIEKKIEKYNYIKK